MAYLIKYDDSGQQAKTIETDVIVSLNNFGFFTIYFPHTDFSLVISKKEAEYLKSEFADKFNL